MLANELLNMPLRGKLLTQEPLADYTSWRVGGMAERLYIPADITDLTNFLTVLPKDEPLTWLGLGSNVLIETEVLLVRLSSL